MIVYLAGNFDLLIYPEKEEELLRKHYELGLNYNRLISFFESHRINGIMQLKKEYDNGKDYRDARIIGEIEIVAAGDSE